MPEVTRPFVAGASAAWRGLQTATRAPEVKRTYLQMVLVLFALAVALDVAGIWGVLQWTAGDGSEGWWANVGRLLLRIAGIALVLLIAPVVSMFLVNILFPLFGERVFFASMRTLSPERASDLEQRDGLPIIASIGHSVVRLLLFLGLSLLTFAISLIPVAGAIIAPILQIYFGARAIAWEMLDPYFDKLQMKFDDQHAFAKRNRAALLGFGLPYGFVMAVPLVGPFVFGLAQAAAAFLIVEVIEADAPMPPTKPSETPTPSA